MRSGDLTPFISRYFDTAVGAKRESASYARIAAGIGHEPRDVTFVSDVSAELDAARAAGMDTILAARPGNPPQPGNTHRAISTFDDMR